ncbi:MAG: hypothetical protein ACREQA_24380 [Candidatus Binatia bacterium]
MKRTITAVLTIFSLMGYSLLAPGNLLAQEESILDRILNPLPEYNPFDKPPPPPQFFPDEVDKRAREALIDTLTNREDSLEGHSRFFMNKDAELKKERRTITGLTEYVQDLYHNTIRDRDRYLAAQTKALASATSPQQKQMIESRLRNDELTQADELMRKSATNRWGAILNRLLSSIDLASIAAGSYIGAAVESALSQLLEVGSVEMPIEERKALALYLEHLKRHPDDTKKGEIQKQIEALEKKKKRAVVQKQMDKAEEAMGKGELARAEFHYETAALIDPSSSEVNRGLERLRKYSQRQEDERKKGLSVATRRDTTNTEDQGFRALLDALTLRDREQIEAQARVVQEKYRGKPLAESARDASAVALEIKGQHEEAKKILEQIARSSNAHERIRAESLLKSPEYNLLASFREARSEHRLQTVKYILLGEDFLKKNLLYSAAPLITSGPAGATAVGAANVIMIGTNLLQVLTSNPISYESVIDKGVDYIRNHPQSESATEVYTLLAEAYEEVGMYERAIAYHEMSGKATEKKIADLKEKAAKSLLRAAERSGERSARESYLKAILDDYPESAAAKEATQKLAQLTKIENQGLRMSKKFLMENPELYGPTGLRLKPTLFDGNLSNLELSDRGVNLLSDREILLHFQTPWGTQSQGYPITKETTDRFQITLRKKNYDVAMEDLHARAKGSPGGIKNLPLPVIRGELDKKSAESGDDATLTLVREATGSSTAFSKVLDHQLLSETEREGVRFKLPPIQGSISRRGFAGLQLPIPLLQGFIPVDFILQGGPGRFSIFPKIQLHKDRGDDQELYR